jgi:hypothetical protein
LLGTGWSRPAGRRTSVNRKRTRVGGIGVLGKVLALFVVIMNVFIFDIFEFNWNFIIFIARRVWIEALKFSFTSILM